MKLLEQIDILVMDYFNKYGKQPDTVLLSEENAIKLWLNNFYILSGPTPLSFKNATVMGLKLKVGDHVETQVYTEINY